MKKIFFSKYIIAHTFALLWLLSYSSIFLFYEILFNINHSHDVPEYVLLFGMVCGFIAVVLYGKKWWHKLIFVILYLLSIWVSFIAVCIFSGVCTV